MKREGIRSNIKKGSIRDELKQKLLISVIFSLIFIFNQTHVVLFLAPCQMSQGIGVQVALKKMCMCVCSCGST